MFRLYDAANPPPRFTDDQPWAGYLHSPTAAMPWPAAKLIAAVDAGGLLPVYLAPLGPNGYRQRRGLADAHSAITQVRALHPAELVVALDTEPQAFQNAPDASITYAAAFTREARREGAAVVHYGIAAFLEQLRPHVDDVRVHPWLAWWTTSNVWPSSLHWPGPRAWQYAHDEHAAGTTVDISRCDDAFPLCRVKAVPAPPPAPPPHPSHSPADVELDTAISKALAELGDTRTRLVVEAAKWRKSRGF